MTIFAAFSGFSYRMWEGNAISCISKVFEVSAGSVGKHVTLDLGVVEFEPCIGWRLLK